MIEKLHKLAVGIAVKYARGKNVDDFISEADEALAMALPKIDFTRPEKEIRHYVSRTVERACNRFRRSERRRTAIYNVDGRELGDVASPGVLPRIDPEQILHQLPSSESRRVGMALFETGRGIRGVAERLDVGYGTAQRLVKRVQSEVGKVLEDVC